MPPHPRIFIVVLLGLGAAILVARALWPLDAVQGFVSRYPGTAGPQPEGTPLWAAVVHAANILVMVMVIRSGLAIRLSTRPAARWTSRRTGPGRKPVTIPIEEWFHVAIDVVWVGIGVLFVTLLAVTGRWVRLVPTHWDIVPNALSVALQYLALHWPDEHGWVAYNALQLLGYFALVFVLAPLAALTGLRLSALWPAVPALNRAFPIARARQLHYPVMVSFVILIALHVGLVASTGIVHNLNHMFALRDDTSPVGPLVALGVVALAVGAWFLVRPSFIKPLGTLFGKVTR
jgi:hypothetical protein